MAFGFAGFGVLACLGGDADLKSSIHIHLKLLHFQQTRESPWLGHVPTGGSRHRYWYQEKDAEHSLLLDCRRYHPHRYRQQWPGGATPRRLSGRPRCLHARRWRRQTAPLSGIIEYEWVGEPGRRRVGWVLIKGRCTYLHRPI